MAAVAADDPAQEPVSLRELAGRTIAVDRRTGSTTESLWAGVAEPPAMIDTDDIDEWLDLIAVGAAAGVTSEATAHHHPRREIRYLAIADAPQIPIAIGWVLGRKPVHADELIELVRGLYTP